MIDFSRLNLAECAPAKEVVTDELIQSLSDMGYGNLDHGKLATALASFCGLVGVPDEVHYAEKDEPLLLQTFTEAKLPNVFALYKSFGDNKTTLCQMDGCVNYGRDGALKALLLHLFEPKLFCREETAQLLVLDNLKQPTSASRIYNVGSRQMLGR